MRPLEVSSFSRINYKLEEFINSAVIFSPVHMFIYLRQSLSYDLV